nr:hypothetical protein [uncultured Chryseobacterium sp.]
MIQHIKLFIPILAFTLISLSCKKKEIQLANTTETEKQVTLNNAVPNIDSHYAVWKFASNNLNQDYKDYTLYISEDSIKILNSGQLVCSGEIVKEKNTFTSYFKSSKTGNEKKELLKKDFGIKGSDDLLAVMNADGDISKKGCQFPFNDMFIVDGYLFFYKDGYHSFVSEGSPKSTESKKQFKFSNITLPYQKKIDYKNAKYDQMSSKGVQNISEFSCGEDQLRYITLEKTKNFNLILVPVDCGDAPYRYYLLSMANNSVISNLYVEGELYEPEGNNIPETASFTINKESVITVKIINKDFKGKNEEKKYIITADGKIVETN